MVRLTPAAYSVTNGDDTAQIQDALNAGDDIFFEPGTFRISSAITIKSSPTKLLGVRGKSILQFVGATDGLVFSDATLRHVVVEGINIQAANASCGKAINLACPNTGAANLVFRDVDVTSTAPGIWAYGFYGDNWQTSSVFSTRIESSATVGCHFQNACNALNFYAVEIAGTAPSDRAIECVAVGLGSEVFFNGCILQGNFAKSLAYITSSVLNYLTLLNCHMENTNGSPSDGADVVNDTSWLTITGGGGASILTSGTSISYLVACSTGSITLGASSSATFILSCDIQSLTDSANNATVLGSRFITGAQITNRVQGNTAASATAGANGAVPSQVAGYLIWNIGGTNYKIPYFNT